MRERRGRLTVLGLGLLGFGELKAFVTCRTWQRAVVAAAADLLRGIIVSRKHIPKRRRSILSFTVRLDAGGLVEASCRDPDRDSQRVNVYASADGRRRTGALGAALQRSD